MDRQRFEIHAEHEASHWWFTARREIVHTLLERVVPPGEGHLVVDVGCGTGANAAAFSEEYDVVGIDPSPDAIRIARERYEGPTFLEGLAPNDVGARMAAARAVLLLDVLEHVEDDVRLLSELFAATRPGTMFVVTVPADRSLWSEHDEVHAHFRRYTTRRLARSWEGLPVRRRLLSGMNTRLYPLVKLVRTVSRLRGGSFGRGGTDLTLPPKPVNGTLHHLFAGERRRLLRELETGKSNRRRQGVSLVAVLERTHGDVAVRAKPAELQDDGFPTPRIAA